MTTEFPLLRPVCQCPETRPKMCPACVAEHVANDKGRPRACIDALIAAHEQIVARVRQGEPYPAIAIAHGVTFDVLVAYLRRTGEYIARKRLRHEQILQAIPRVLEGYQAGQSINSLAATHKISSHTIRLILQKENAVRITRRTYAPRMKLQPLTGEEALKFLRAASATPTPRSTEEEILESLRVKGVLR